MWVKSGVQSVHFKKTQCVSSYPDAYGLIINMHTLSLSLSLSLSHTLSLSLSLSLSLAHTHTYNFVIKRKHENKTGCKFTSVENHRNILAVFNLYFIPCVDIQIIHQIVLINSHNELSHRQTTIHYILSYTRLTNSVESGQTLVSFSSQSLRRTRCSSKCNTMDNSSN